MREIIIRWLDEAAKLKCGSKLHLVASTGHEQNVLYEAIIKELKVMRKIDPMVAATLLPFKMFKSGRFWVGIEVILAAPTLGFIRDPNGTMRKIRLPDIDSDRARRLKLMCEDGLPIETIEELEGPLSKNETQEIQSMKEE